LFFNVSKEYHAAKDKYTKGIGGGLGKPSNIYLAVVHMWDKDYSFPFLSVKESIAIGLRN
jgi:hypothetical protein